MEPLPTGESRGEKVPEFSMGYTVRLYLKIMSMRGVEGRGGETRRSEANSNKTKIRKTQRFSCLSYSGAQAGKERTPAAVPVSILATGIQNQNPEPQSSLLSQISHSASLSLGCFPFLQGSPWPGNLQVSPTWELLGLSAQLRLLIRILRALTQ